MTVPALHDESNWSVASFEGGKVGPYNPTPWHFRPAGTVEAEGHWTANWREIEHDRIRCQMTSGGHDVWDVIFVNPHWFVGYKGDNLYRLGKRL